MRFRLFVGRVFAHLKPRYCFPGGGLLSSPTIVYKKSGRMSNADVRVQIDKRDY